MEKIQKDIEKLKSEINILIENIDRYSHGKILETSQELDKLICKYIKLYHKEPG